MNIESNVHCIKAIDRATVHKICSGQVVLSLATAVKELVENSIDAGASIIDVRLKQYGKELIEVVDNGHGVKETDFESLTLKHHTSKIEDFSDLTTVQTFGFRGEALSSLCALCNVEIVTCHSDSELGTRLIFDNNGNILQKLTTPRQVGTTVNLKNLFVTLPVRHKEFHKNLNKEFSKMVNLLNAYCIITQNKRITCTNTTDKGRQTTILSTNCSSSIKENLMCVFGNKQACSLLKFEQVPPSEAVLEEFFLSPSEAEKSAIFQLEGYISTSIHGQGRSTPDRQFFFIDGRPCDLPKVSKIMNNVYHSFNRHQYPFICINIILKEGSADVNVTPDKRLIFLPQEKILMATIKTSLLNMYDRQPSEEMFSSSLKNHFLTQNKVTAVSSVVGETKEQEGLLLNHKRSLSCDSINQSPQPLKNLKISEEQLATTCNDSKKEDSPLLVSIKNALSNGHTSSPNASLSAIPTPFQKNNCLSKRFINFSAIVPFKEVKLINKLQPTLNGRSPVLSDMLKHARWKASAKFAHDEMSHESEIDISSTDQIENGQDVGHASEDCVDGDISDISERKCVSFDEKILSFAKEPIDDFSEDVVCSESVDEPSAKKRKYVKCPFMMEVLQRRLKTRERKKATNKINYLKFRSKISPNENQQAEEELRKEINKDSFPQMEIIGQFNLGFIITKLHSDLFIVDQHATDEKYNFEVLQRDNVLETQKLIVPLPLELTVSSEAVLLDNLNIFEKNGFKFNINDGTQLGDRIQLVSVPVSHNWSFGKEDVDEIIFMLSDNPVTMVRPSRVIQMFASRACRKSVMIGTALSIQTMKKLITHMGEMEKPWNCPHGRPTMRHLFSLNLLHSD